MATRRQQAQCGRACALDKKKLWREIERDERVKARARLVDLRSRLKDARASRKQAIRDAVDRCRSERLAARERARALRVRALAELREAVRLEREAARESCTLAKKAARGKDEIERRRAELAAEAAYQADLRRIERANAKRRREHPHATYIERRSESDDEVRGNIPKEMVALFERVKRGIKGTPRMTRTEAFLKYAEEHPDEILAAVEDQTDALVRELEQRASEEERALKKGPRKAAPKPEAWREVASDIPF